MAKRRINLSWVSVSDIDQAVKFYTDVIGLKLLNKSEHYPWAELGSPDGEGAVLGLAGHDPSTADGTSVPPGSNAVVTMSVDDLNKEMEAFKQKGVKLLGEMMEVPGHVKMQMFEDLDGNRFQIVEML